MEKVQRPTLKQGVGTSVLKREAPELLGEGEDMVCSPWRHGAGVTAHRDSVANYLDRRFDGDALNVSIAMDKFMADSWYPLEPRFNVLDMNKPFGVSGNPAMPKPVISSISSWIEG